jgi:mono/diheme cytochrome c family protein
MTARPRSALIAMVVAAALGGAAATLPAHSADSSFANLARGKRMVDAGDCVACHTADGGKPFAGGRPIETPFGVIYSPNITPDRDTGIGAWSDEDFYRAMHEGIAADGSRLYPAFPYPYFTKMTRDDVMAVRAYLATVPAVRSERPRNALTWPLNNRVFMRGWNMMFFKSGTFQPQPDKSAEWNRGAIWCRAPATAAPATRRRPCSAATRPAKPCVAGWCRTGSRRRSPTPKATASATGASTTWSNT